MSRRSLALLSPLLLSLSACAETYTIRQLGHPEFEKVVGADAQFERVGTRQVGQLDAFPATADDEGDHRFLHTIWPSGSADAVYLDVRAGQRQPTGLPLRSLTVGVYALDAQQAQTFALDGALPEPEQPLTVVTTQEKQEGVLGVLLELPRAAIPAGTAKLAFPILVQFEDGWIHLLFYQTGIPAAVNELTPEELERLREEQGRQQGAGGPGGGEAPPPSEEAPPPSEEAPPSEEMPPGDAGDAGD